MKDAEFEIPLRRRVASMRRASFQRAPPSVSEEAASLVGDLKELHQHHFTRESSVCVLVSL